MTDKDAILHYNGLLSAKNKKAKKSRSRLSSPANNNKIATTKTAAKDGGTGESGAK